MEPRQIDPVKARRPLRPRFSQGQGRLRQFGPGAQGAPRLVGGQGKPLDGEDVQPPALGPGPAPQVQQGGDVQPGAEPQLGHGEMASPGPGVRQAAAFQEDGAGLGQTVVA